jgi:hypothetical protein
MWKCKHCLKEFDLAKSIEKANHSRWCDLNPKRAQYSEQARNVQLARGKKVKYSEEHRKKISQATKENWKAGKYVGQKHTPEAKLKISDAARKSKHRRLLKSCRDYLTKDGQIIKLDSSWEQELAIRMDALEIRWDRPEEPLIWIDASGKQRHYFPDFWLPDFQIFLDPKNPAAFEKQHEKITWLLSNRNDIVFLRTLEECKTFSPP